MFSTCLHCTKDLGTNEIVETLPIGRRLAFDAAQGRLWVVCRHCAKWNLVPFDTRLESIDACERLYRDTKTRYATDNIGLARVKEGLELVRIGAPLRPEFASWRYGEQYRRRRRRAVVAGGVGVVGAAGAGLALLGAAGTPWWGAIGLGYAVVQAGWQYGVDRLGGLKAIHPGTGGRLNLPMAKLREALISWDDDVWRIDVPLAEPDKDTIETVSWTGPEFTRLGRKIVGNLNLTVGKPQELEYAAEVLDHHRGDLSAWLKYRIEVFERFTTSTPPNWDNPPISVPVPDVLFLRVQSIPAGERLAVEMWLSEDAERIWLEGELKLLEREWRDAERIAKISDDLQFDDEQGTVNGER
jgi:hypothetical protein